MGVCCNKIENKTNKDALKKENSSLTQLKNQPVDYQKSKGSLPITLDQVNKSIDEWKELTKRRKPNRVLNEQFKIDPEDDLNNCLRELKCDETDRRRNSKYHLNENFQGSIDVSNNEINQDFLNINKRVIKNFSDISSTINFTCLNSKDLISSKLNKIQLQALHANSHSMLTFIEELNMQNMCINKRRESNNTNPMPSRNNKMYIQNNNIFNAKSKIFL